MSTPIQSPRRARRSLSAASVSLVVLLVGAFLALSDRVDAQTTRDPGFTIDQILTPAFRYGLASSAKADRIAWIEAERGMRNVFTAAAPDFKPVRLTSTVEDDAVDLTSVQVSDDGSVVVFVRGHSPNFKGQIGNQAGDAEGGRREVWAAPSSGARAPWRVVALAGGGGGGGGGGNASPLSPDGKWVLQVRGGQIYRAAVDPGNTDAATIDAAPPLFVTLGVNSNPAWSPDSKKIAFVSARYDQRQYFETQGQVTTHSFITVYDLDSRKITYLAPSVDRDTSPVWSADGRRIAFVRRPGLPYGHFATATRNTPRSEIPAGFLEAKFAGGYTTSLWVADVASGQAFELWHTQAGDSPFDGIGNLVWAGDNILFQAEPTGWQHWFSVSVSNPAPQPIDLTPGEGMVEDVAFSPDGRWLYFTANHGDLDRRHLWRTPTAGGRTEQLTRGSRIETVIAMMGSGQMAVQQSGPAQPVAVAVVAAAGGEPRVISSAPPAAFPAAKHVTPETVVIKAADGLDAHSVLFLPPGIRPGERRPALLYVHGGGGRSVLGYPDQSNGYYHITYGLIQYFVNKGYIVAAVNYRGDPMYGGAFANPTEFGADGVSEYRDVIAAGLWLKNRPDVDPERLGVWGLSYGGWLTGQALSRNSDVFKAGMIHAGVQLRSTSLDEDNLGYQSSPAYNIEKWTSPTLVVHGDDDRSVEFSQTVGVINLFRAHGVPHEVIVYPDETHYFMRHALWIEEFNAIDDFFDRTLIRKEGVRVTGTREEGR